MIRMLGVLLIFGGGGGMAMLTMQKRQKEVETVGELLSVLHRMEREIRSEGRGLRPIFAALAEDAAGEAGAFFCVLLQHWEEEPEQSLSRQWERAAADLLLSEEGQRIWRELGRRLAGDEESVGRGIAIATEELTALQMRLRDTLPEQRRVVTALSLSAAAFLSVLLL